MQLVRLARSDDTIYPHSVERMYHSASVSWKYKNNQRCIFNVASHLNDTAVCCHEDRLTVSRSQEEHVDLKCLQH